MSLFRTAEPTPSPPAPRADEPQGKSPWPKLASLIPVMILALAVPVGADEITDSDVR